MSLIPLAQEAMISEYTNHNAKAVALLPSMWPDWSLPSWTASYSYHLGKLPTLSQECDSDFATEEQKLA